MDRHYSLKSIVLALMLFTSFISMAQVTNVTQNTNYTTIGAAITAAQVGDVITVAAGTYNGDITINKSITLKGANAGIAGTGTRSAESIINSSKVNFTGSITAVFDGFKVYQTGNATETVTIASTSSVTLKNNVIERFGVSTGTIARAVYTNTDATGAIVIDKNKFTGDDSGNLFGGHKTWQSGIWTSGNTNLTISNNYFEHCRSAMNINTTSAGVTITGNTFTDNGQHITIGGTPSDTYVMGVNEFGTTRDGIVNLSGPQAGYRLNISSSTFEGVLASQLPLTSQFTLEAKMYHKGRLNRNGMVVFVPNNIYVVNSLSTIQLAVNYAVNGNVINISPGTYNEEVSLNKAVTLKGTDAATTIIRASANAGYAVGISSNNAVVRNLTLTRNVPDLSTWFANTNSSNSGIQIGAPGAVIDNVIVKRNRSGFLIHSSGASITNSVIEENRTGLHMGGDLSGMIITNNRIINNTTHGVLFNPEITGNSTNVTGVLVNNNMISGNYHTQISFKNNGSASVTGSVMATCNWLGNSSPVTSTAATTEPGYTTQVPAFFGGTQPATSIDADLGSAGIGSIVATPHLTLGTNASAGVGFDGNMASCDAITTHINNGQCGTTLTAFSQSLFATSIPGATAYRFRVNNGFTIQVVEKSNPHFSLSNLPEYGYAGTYTIDVSAFVNGAWTIYGASCAVQGPPIPATKVWDSQCGGTFNFSADIYANGIAQVSKYRFRVTNGSNVQVLETTNNWFKLRHLQSYAYMTTYTVEVAAFSNGVWAEYGVACQIHTPEALPVTQLTTATCGMTAATFSTDIYCNTVPLAEAYRFRVNSTSGLEVIERPATLFRLNQITGYNYGISYTIDVSVRIGGEWSEYGATCLVHAPAVPPVTGLRAADCGATIATRNTVVYPNLVVNAGTYRFRVISSLGTHILDRPVGNFRFNQLPVVIPAGETVVVDVMTISTNSISSAYGPACNLTLTASARQAQETSIAKVVAYPNPYTAGFAVQTETTSTEKVVVSVYDMSGRPLETFSASPSGLAERKLGYSYAAGIYNIVVTQGAEKTMLQVVKK